MDELPDRSIFVVKQSPPNKISTISLTENQACSIYVADKTIKLRQGVTLLVFQINKVYGRGMAGCLSCTVNHLPLDYFGDMLGIEELWHTDK